MQTKDFEDLNNQFSVLEDLGLTGLGVTLLAGLLSGGIFLGIVGIIGSCITGWQGGSLLSKNAEIKEKVVECGVEKFIGSVDQIFEDIEQIIISAFKKPVEKSDEIIESAIAYYENLLGQAEKKHSINLERRDIEKILMHQKYEEIEQIRNDINTLLAQEME